MNKLLLFATLAFLLLSLGCISEIEERDRLNSTMDFNLNDYLGTRQSPFPTNEPCTCLVCSKEPEHAWYNLFGLSSDETETALADAECKFVHCNATTYAQTIGDSEPEKGDWSICSMLGSTKICLPKFFMIGAGASSAEFSLAQKYCAGDLSMPVIWTIPQDGKPPKTPQPETLMCHLSKSQMPIIVWYSEGKYIDSPSYTNLLKSLNNASADPEISGPIMVTTEALAEPYYINSNGKKLLNISLLEKVKRQIEAIKLNCPKCISVLALKPTFNDSQMPDLCPLDYFFTYRVNDPNKDPNKLDYLGCANKYPQGGYISRPAVSGFGKNIDVVGIAFNANENENLTTCTPLKSIAQHSIYSKQVLNNFYTPTVWYSVAMSEGPTSTPYCAFNQDDITRAYSDLMRGISGHVSNGIIGIAPYKLIDTPSSGPFMCNQWEMPKPDIFSLDEITPNQKIFFDGGSFIEVSKLLQTQDDKIIFADSQNRTYLAYMDSITLKINRTGCNFGVVSMDGQPKNDAHFAWFSSCQYYHNDRGPLFRTNLNSLSQIKAGQFIESDDGIFKIFVESINESSEEEVVFFASSGQVIRRFAAQPDGDKIMIYDAPRVPSTQQPLMFSSNGVGGQCSVFEANKMFFRSNVATTRPKDAPAVLVPENEKLLEQIQTSQCGNCLSFAPMPAAFCDAKAYLADKEIKPPDFPKDACIQYLEMDSVFLQYSLDPVLMRAIAVGESSLGNGIDHGIDAPACQMSSADKDNSNCGSNKDPEDLEDYESNYCASQTLHTKAKAIEDAGNRVCALGTFQCIRGPGDDSDIDAPSGDYNPFEPSDSAACGVYEFKEKGDRYDDTLSKLKSLKSQYPNIPMFDLSKGGIGDMELEWYAAWIAAYHYSGMGVASLSILQSYTPRDENDNLVKYMHNYLEAYCTNNPDKICYEYYGTKFIIRYNAGIDVCQNGCIPNYC